jgi:DASS family divalent anion:Na+ symporter
MHQSIRLNSGFLLAIICLIGISISILPTPDGVDAKAYPLFGIFIAVIIGILLQPYPMLIISLCGFFACLIFGLISPVDGFACFGQSVTWIVVFASIAAKAFVKTNLGRRIACIFIQKMGNNSLKLAYGVTLSEFILAPMIPSNTARASCVTIPLTVSVSESLGSSPINHSEGIIGRFLALCALHANQLSCPLFLTAMAANPITQQFMADFGVNISWMEWFIIVSVPGIACLFLMPLLLYRLVPPQLTNISNFEEIANTHLSYMSPMKRDEYLTVGIFVCMLIGWIFGSTIHVSTGVVALGGLCALLVTNILDIDDITGAKDIWGICLWLSILNVIALKLTEFGLVQYYASTLQIRLAGIVWPYALLIVSLTYFGAHYLIPGNVLHACAMFPSFMQLLMTCGVPSKISGMSLAAITAFCGFITPYGASSCPLFFNTGYIDQGLWWRIGLITAFAYFVIWIIFGSVWLKLLALW